MDDLLQSLLAGQGTHTRPRIGGVESVADGTAFGVAFDALLSADTLPDSEGQITVEDVARAIPDPSDVVLEEGVDRLIRPTGVQTDGQTPVADGQTPVPPITSGAPHTTSETSATSTEHVFGPQAAGMPSKVGEGPNLTPPVMAGGRHNSAAQTLTAEALPTGRGLPTSGGAITASTTPGLAPKVDPTPQIATPTPAATLTPDRAAPAPNGRPHPLPVSVADSTRANPNAPTPLTPAQVVPTEPPRAAIGLPGGSLPQTTTSITAQPAQPVSPDQATFTAKPVPAREAGPVLTSPQVQSAQQAQPAQHATFLTPTAALAQPQTPAEAEQTPPLIPDVAKQPEAARTSADTTPLRAGSWSTPTSGPALLPQSPTAFPVQQVATPSLAEISLDVFPDIEFSLHTPMTQTAASSLTASLAPPGPTPSATAHAIAQQLAAALNNPSRDAGGPVELTLDPPELGRVRMHMAEISGIMTLTILAERPETAELMRRHLSLLAQEFADAGLDAPSVRISQEGADQDGQRHEGDTPGEQTRKATIADTNPTHPTPQRTTSGALDLRL